MNFQQALKSYTALRRQYDNGTLAAKEFAERVYKLRLKDEQGIWWQVRPEDGGWFIWDGSSWVPAALPGTKTQPRQTAASQMEKPRMQPSLSAQEGSDAAVGDTPVSEWIPIEEDEPIQVQQKDTPEIELEPAESGVDEETVRVPSLPSFEEPTMEAAESPAATSNEGIASAAESAPAGGDFVEEAYANTAPEETRAEEMVAAKTGTLDPKAWEINTDQPASPKHDNETEEVPPYIAESAPTMLATDIPMWRVRIDIGARAGERFEVDDRLSIGRESDNVLQLLDPLVSRHHALIRRDGVICYLEDLVSSNGTYLNGEKILRPTLLRAGDRVAVGSTEMQVELIE